MIRETNSDYFRRRAAQELAAAAHAADERAAQSHRDLATRFEALASEALPELWSDQHTQMPGTLAGDLRIIP